MFKSRALVCVSSTIVALASLSFGANQNRINGAITGAPTAQLTRSVHHMALPEFDQGSADPSMRMGTMTLLTTPTPAQKQALQKLLAEQQDRKSSNYHKWLTPEQYADRFGLSQSDIKQITTWLTAHGFTKVHAARGRNWVSFTGSAAQVQAAFATQIHRYNVKGEQHFANATAPMVPANLAGVVAGIRGLDDFRPRPRAQRPHPHWFSAALGNSFVAPGDVARIYDLNALYTAGIDGTGQTIAVMGQTDVYLSDLNNFRSGFGLAPYTCTADANDIITACDDPHFKYVLDGTDPGLSTNGDIGEADLDLQWSGAVARGAKIIYVNSTDTFTSYYFAIDQNISPVISLSYGFCEFADHHLLADETELQMANALGITFINSSGDSGAAECDFFATVTSDNLATRGLAVSYPASSPEVTGVGGTGILLADWDNPTFWGQPTTNPTDGGTALSYVPEQVWNDDLEIAQFCQLPANTTNKFCTQGGTIAVPGWVPITTEANAQTDIGLSSSGGGASNCTTLTGSQCTGGFPKPTWQTVTVAGTGSVRLSPDVSFLGTPNFPGYVFCAPLSELSNTTDTTSSCANGIQDAVDTNQSIIGGTSASAPVFAGVVALLNQYLGGSSSQGLGNVNPMLYQLAISNPNAFHQVTSGDNNVSCQVGTPAGQTAALQCPASGVIGFSAASTDPTGYNLVAGLGSMDVNNFVTAWAATRTGTTTTLISSSSSSPTGASVTLTATVSNTSDPLTVPTGMVTFSNGTTSLGTSTLTTGTATLNTSALPVGTNSITATYNGSGSLGTSTSSAVTVTVTQGFSLAAKAASYQVAQGSSVDGVVTLTLDPSFSGTVTFSCTDPAGLSVCTVPPPTNVSGDVSFHITTATPTAKLERPADRAMRIFYAALLPGLLGIVFTASSRKRSRRGLQLLGLIAVLGLSTIWMSSCGGGSSGNGNGNPGTPKGTYTISVTGASNGATASTSFQLVVQ